MKLNIIIHGCFIKGKASIYTIFQTTTLNNELIIKHLHVQGHPYLNHPSQIYGPNRRNLVSDHLCESDALCHLEFPVEMMQSLKKDSKLLLDTA